MASEDHGVRGRHRDNEWPLDTQALDLSHQGKELRIVGDDAGIDERDELATILREFIRQGARSRQLLGVLRRFTRGVRFLHLLLFLEFFPRFHGSSFLTSHRHPVS